MKKKKSKIKEQLGYNPLWVNITTTYALLDAKTFKELFKNMQIKTFKLKPSNILKNDDIVFWDYGFYYDRYLFDECLELANKLSTEHIELLMPTKVFPMGFEIIDGNKRKLYLLLAPRTKQLDFRMMLNEK